MDPRVQLDDLTIVDFRNIEKLVLSPGPRFNIVSGKNGMGKTNLLEAVYMLGALRSFRTTAGREQIHHGAAAAGITGLFGQAAAGMKCKVVIEPEGRKVTVDGKAVGFDGGHFRSLPMVLFHPGNMELVQGGPEHRRRFIDRSLFQAEPSYPPLHRSYGRALASRNKLLKSRSVDRQALMPYDEQLAQMGARIMEMRSAFLSSMNALFEEAVKEVSGGGAATMTYKPKVGGGPVELAQALDRSFPVDKDRGFTSMGPHGDDILFLVSGKPARKFASQGQQRTVVLAAKIAETRALTKSTRRVPLLLLDDVSSELDRDRNRQLFNFLHGVGGQAFITTTHLDHIPIDAERVDFYVSDGRITRLG